jgi:hypothetical protein
VTYPPPRQRKPDADEHMHQKEKDEEYIEIGMDILSRIQ